MSEIDVPETDAEVEAGDEVDGCELDFGINPTSDDEIASFLATSAAPMKEKSEEEWEQETDEEES